MTVEPPEGDGKSITNHRRDLAEQGPGLQRPAPSQAATAHRQADDRRRPGAVRFIPDGDMGRFAEELPGKLLGDFTDTMKLLRTQVPEAPDRLPEGSAPSSSRRVSPMTCRQSG